MLHTMRIMAPSTTTTTTATSQQRYSRTDSVSDSSSKRRHIHLSGGVFMVQKFLTILLIVVAALHSQINAVQATNLGSKCQHDMDCTDFIKGSTCSANGYCECAPYFVQYDDSTCLSSQLLGGDCLLDDQCTMKVANSSCSDGACRCVEGFLQFRKHTCLGPALPGAVCYSHAHCRMYDERTHCDFLIPNLFGRCQCTAPAKLNGGLCVEQQDTTATATATATAPVASTTAATIAAAASTANEVVSPPIADENEETEDIDQVVSENNDAKVDAQATADQEEQASSENAVMTDEPAAPIQADELPAKTSVQQMLTPVDVTTEHMAAPALNQQQPTEVVTEDYPYKIEDEYAEEQPQQPQQSHHNHEQQVPEAAAEAAAAAVEEPHTPINVEPTIEDSQTEHIVPDDSVQNAVETEEDTASKVEEQQQQETGINLEEEAQAAENHNEEAHIEEQPEQETNLEEVHEHDNEQAESSDLAEDTMKFDYDAAQDEYENENENDRPEAHNVIDQEQAESEHINEVETNLNIIEDHGESQSSVAPTEANFVKTDDEIADEEETDHSQPQAIATEGIVDQKQQNDHKAQTEHENESENETETGAAMMSVPETETEAAADVAHATESEVETETETETEHNGDQLKQPEHMTNQHALDKQEKDEEEATAAATNEEEAPAATQQTANESEKPAIEAEQYNAEEEVASATETVTETTENAVHNELESASEASVTNDQEVAAHEPVNVVAASEPKPADEPAAHEPLPANLETELSESTGDLHLENIETSQVTEELDNTALTQPNTSEDAEQHSGVNDPETQSPAEAPLTAADVAESTHMQEQETHPQETSSPIKVETPEEVFTTTANAAENSPQSASNVDPHTTQSADHVLETDIAGAAASVDDINKEVSSTNAPIEPEHANEISLDASNEDEQPPETVSAQKESNPVAVTVAPEAPEVASPTSDVANAFETVAMTSTDESPLETDQSEKIPDYQAAQIAENSLPEKDFKESESIADILSDLMTDDNNEEATTLSPVEDSLPAESNDLPIPDLLTDNSSLSEEHFATGEVPTTEQSDTAEVLVETLNPNDAINQEMEPSTSTEKSNAEFNGDEDAEPEHTLSPEELPFDMTSLEDTLPQELESDNLVTEGSNALAAATADKAEQTAAETEKDNAEEDRVEEATANPSDYVEITTQTMLGLASRVTLMEPAAPIVTTLKPLMASPTATEEVAASEIATPEPAKLSTSTHNAAADGSAAANSKLTTEIRKRVDLGLEAVSLGLSCINDKQCQLADPHTVCNSRGVCDCAATGTMGEEATTQNSCSAERTGCSKGTFQCRSSGVCISWFFVCDGRDDCNDASDEECTFNARLNQTCPSQAFLCEHSGRCISRAALCDGRKQCPHGEDELGCAGVLKSVGGVTSCPPHTFRCNSGECLPEYEYCNAIISCRDGSDEPPHLCGERPMPNYFQRLLEAGGLIGSGRGNDPAGNCPHRCSNGRCRSTAIVCSGRDGCGDGTDEQTCSVCRCPAPSNHNLPTYLARQRPMPLW